MSISLPETANYIRCNNAPLNLIVPITITPTIHAEWTAALSYAHTFGIITKHTDKVQIYFYDNRGVSLGDFWMMLETGKIDSVQNHTTIYPPHKSIFIETAKVVDRYDPPYHFLDSNGLEANGWLTSMPELIDEWRDYPTVHSIVCLRTVCAPGYTEEAELVFYDCTGKSVGESDLSLETGEMFGFTMY